MEIYFLVIGASPTETHSEYGSIAGAYVSCWVKAPSPMEAQNLAIAEIRGDGSWKIERIETAPHANFELNDENATYLHQAHLDGECYVFHTYRH